MADTTPTIKDVHKVLKKAIADLEAMGVEVPASLFLAMILVQRHAVDQDGSDA